MYPKKILYYGIKEPLPKQVSLHAGPLSMIYESGRLRYIKHGGGTEILRMVYVALRDGEWRTYTAYISNEKITQQEKAFHITYDCHYESLSGEKLFSWQAEITGDANGSILFRMDGEALADFQKNRLGFCVLHSIQACAGKTCEITHPDGSKSKPAFPEYISPHQPFKNIQAMQYAVSENAQVQIIFSGDIFETEDQRNWTDASYKTYCTPLEVPFPAHIKKGTTISQSVEVRISGEPARATIDHSRQALTFSIDQSKSIPLPKIGIGANNQDNTLSANETGLLSRISFTHYRIELVLYKGRWKTQLAQAVETSVQLNLPLAIVLVFGEHTEEELHAFIKEAKNKNARIQSITLLQKDAAVTPETLINAAVPLLRENFTGVKIGAGTSNFFADLNRNRIPTSQIDFLSYSANPQVHAFDNLSLIENMEGPVYSVESARKFSNDTAIYISPVSLNMPTNPDDITEQAVYNPPVMPAKLEPRQLSLFGAGWTLGSIKNLAEAGTASLTYYQTKGMEGIIQGDAHSPLPEQFPATAGMVFPVYYVFKYILDFTGATIIPTVSSAPLQFSSLLLTKNSKQRLILANHTITEQKISVPALSRQAVIKLLDEDTAQEAMHQPDLFLEKAFQKMDVMDGNVQVQLKPFGIAVIDFLAS